MRSRSAAASLIAGLILSACVPAAQHATPTVAPAGTAEPPTPAAKPTAPTALVGTWVGAHNCERIMSIMTAAGMPEQGLLNVAESGTLAGVSRVDQIKDPERPCDGAVDQRHSHFFTADGRFGSRDMHDVQVDDGQWRLVDADTFTINGTAFDFQVDGDELRMEAVDVGSCPSPDKWCPEAWKLMVAMPGMGWTMVGSVGRQGQPAPIE